jgi:hypothetical protein
MNMPALLLDYSSSSILFADKYLLVSNYWSPKLYFQAQNGSFIDVPIIGDTSGGNLGGMAIYYCELSRVTTTLSH